MYGIFTAMRSISIREVSFYFEFLLNICAVSDLKPQKSLVEQSRFERITSR